MMDYQDSPSIRSIGSTSMLSTNKFALMPEKDLLNLVNRAAIGDSYLFLEGANNFKISMSQFFDALEKNVTVLINRPLITRNVTNFMNDTIDGFISERNIYCLFLKCFATDEYVRDEGSSSESLRDFLLVNDPEFRTLFTLLKWSESVAEETIDGFASGLSLFDELIKLDNVLGNTIMEINNGSKSISSLSTDLRFKDKEALLNSEDVENIKGMVKLILGLIRCGRVNEGIQLAIQTKFASMISLLKVRNYLYEPELTIPNENKLGFTSSFKSRDCVKSIAKRFLDKNLLSYIDADKILFATIADDIDVLMEYAGNFNDKLWSLLSVAINNRFDNAMENRFGYKSKIRRKMKQGMTVKDIFEELERKDTHDYYGLVKYIVMEEFPACIKFMYKKLKDSKERKVSKEHLVKPNTVRMYANITILFKKFDIEIDLEEADEIISSYIDVLKDMEEFVLIPFYISMMSDGVREEEARSFLSGITNDEERIELLDLCKKHKLDTRNICLLLSDKCTSPTDSNNDLGQISSWLWLLDGGDETLFEALETGCKLLCYFLLNNKMACFDKVLKALPDNIVERIESFDMDESMKENIKSVNLEFLSFKVYDDICSEFHHWRDCLEKIRSSVFEKKTSDELAKLSFVEKDAYQTSLSDFEAHIAYLHEIADSTKEKFSNAVNLAFMFPSGWFSSATNDEEHSNDLKKVRSICLYRTFKMLLDCHSISNDTKNVLNVIELLTNNNTSYIEDLCEEDRKDLFGSALQYVGSLKNIFTI
uniref:Nuclear pore complex protein n=1 Tax=Parastrongyloides trichosuri TaxID=131310 RepID=A0A0N4Z296_PARTI